MREPRKDLNFLFVRPFRRLGLPEGLGGFEIGLDSADKMLNEANMIVLADNPVKAGQGGVGLSRGESDRQARQSRDLAKERKTLLDEVITHRGVVQ